MKITQKEKEFMPITITLETQKEAHAMWRMAQTASAPGEIDADRELGVAISQFFERLLKP